MRKLIIGFAALAVAVAYTSGPLIAADSNVSTKIFLDKPGKKTKWLSKDASVAVDPNNASATVEVCTGTDPNGDTFGPVALTGNKSNTTFKAKNLGGCKIILVKPGKLSKALCAPGANLPTDPNSTVSVRLTVGANRYCGTCGGTVKDKAGKLTKRKDCDNTGSCTCGSPSGAFLD